MVEQLVAMVDEVDVIELALAFSLRSLKKRILRQLLLVVSVILLLLLVPLLVEKLLALCPSCCSWCSSSSSRMEQLLVLVVGPHRPLPTKLAMDVQGERDSSVGFVMMVIVLSLVTVLSTNDLANAFGLLSYWLPGVSWPVWESAEKDSGNLEELPLALATVALVCITGT